ncbi:MAG: methyltransferase domain-containing protein [Bacteroidota bacterium]|nr:methyltransferase domain-containing protein [Bacteroidota bacterium]MDP3145218.1 methyltransferase domain-containing protein [Bacteroidota bacterium]
MEKLPYINLGCGSKYNELWVNVDFISTGKDVIAHNLTLGIPFKDNSFKAAYHSHVLEHFTKADAEKFIAECYRILQPNGILRIAIPDLEAIARNYIKFLDASLANDKSAKEKYNWTMLEMYDQVVRAKGGGEMIDYIMDETKNNDDFLIERNGNETKLLIANFRNSKNSDSETKSARGFIFSNFKERVKNKLIQLLLKEDIKALNIGRFRLGGEIHQWMYDRYSLAELLKKHGFSNPKVVAATESQIPDWNSFNLDVMDGKVRKPDSLFMEAVKI